jgi:hypothetical protein
MAARTNKKAPATEGERRGQTLRLTPAAWRQLKILAIDEGTSSHDLLLEAVDMLFQDRGLKPLARKK